MLITALTIAIAAAAGGVLAFLVVQGRAKDRLCNLFDASMYEPFSVFSVLQAFDPDQAIIWDTQFPALQLIDEASEGLRVGRLRLFYTRSARSYPELYDGSTFKSWLAFLEREKLISRMGRRLFITVEGHELLSYRIVSPVISANKEGRS